MKILEADGDPRLVGQRPDDRGRGAVGMARIARSGPVGERASGVRVEPRQAGPRRTRVGGRARSSVGG